MSEIKGVNCIVDTNYILYKNVYTLAKNKELYGNLERSLEATFEEFLNKYPFKNIFMVCDSKQTWRKEVFGGYKEKRKELRDKVDVDWEYVYNTYDSFKSKMINPRITYLEIDGVEGDDIIRHLIKKSNEIGISTLTIASDADLNQLLDYSIAPNKSYINIQWFNKWTDGKVYLPYGYKLFINKIRENKGDLFNMNENSEFLGLYDGLIDKDAPIEVDTQESLFVKIIQGDSSDNIDSVLKVPMKKDPTKFRGIGKAGAEKIFTAYKSQYPNEIDFMDDSWIEDVVEFVAENKKVDVDEYENEIVENIKMNRRLIHLHERHLPRVIREKIEVVY
jgi:5'-3' exonuclease